MTWLRSYWWLLAGGLALLWWLWPARRKKVSAEQAAIDAYNAGQAAAAKSAALATSAASTAVSSGHLREKILAAGGVNVDTDVTHLTVPDQALYPGWRVTGDGSWYNYDTGEFYQAGTRPPAIPLSAYESGAMVRADVSGTVQEIEARGAIAVPPETFPDAVIH